MTLSFQFPFASHLLWWIFGLSFVSTSIEGHVHGGCSTKSHPLKDLEVTQQKIESLKRLRSGIDCIGCITIDTYVYVIQGATAETTTTNAIIQEQIKVLNAGFSRTPFKFKLLQANFVTDAYYHLNWFTAAERATSDDTDPLALVAKYPRRGDYATLNMWFGGAEEKASFATFPASGGVKGNPTDGTYILLPELPDQINCDETCNSFGTTAVHEVGHWLGLEHVFHSVTGKSCDPNDKNDFVDDTPQMANIEAGTNFECPLDSTDTCPLLPGKDPIHNYMDYSSDDCVFEFTPGQIQRMYYVWSIYRKTSEVCSSGYKLFELEILTDEYGCELTWTLESTDGKFSWNTDPGQSSIVVYLPDSSLTTLDVCLDVTKDYVFTIYDSPGDGVEPDGILSPGYYAIRYNGRQIKKNTAYEGASERTSFTGSLGAPPPTPAPPTKAPTTSGGGGGFICFSGTSLVQVKGDKGVVQMNQLEIGDLVLTTAGSNNSDDRFEKVYSFGHRAEYQVASFLKITTSSSAALELSPNHMVFVKSGSAVPASRIKVGDKLVMAHHELDTVTSIVQVTRKGVYAPFTPSGTILVNGIKASTFVAFQDSTFFKVGGIPTGLSYQWMAHAFEFPHRMWCNQLSWFSSSCKEEQYVDGISSWVVVPHRIAQWLVKQNALVMILFGIPVVAMFTSFRMIEMIWMANAFFLVLMLMTIMMTCVVGLSPKTSVIQFKSKTA